jgi:hypothetical protein
MPPAFVIDTPDRHPGGEVVLVFPCRAVVSSVLNLVVCDVQYLLNLCVRYAEKESCLNLEPLIT